ncbi:MAG: electron transfer flavoprotein subunit beta/FixA family protein, partial [Planctomycetota bacterium]
MKIIVCTKVVPDSETRPKPDAAGTGLDTSDVKWIVNPYDEYAIEQAVQLKEAGKAEHLLLLCLSATDVQKELRTALARGADAARILRVPADADNFAAAKALADDLKGQDFGLLFFGKEAIDDQQSAIGPMVATLLDLPCVTAIDQFALEGDTATVRRGIEGGAETVKVTLPAVFTTDKGLNEPRFTNLKGIM